MSVEFSPLRVGRLFQFPEDVCHVEKSFDERLGKPTDIREARILIVKLEAGSLEAKAGHIPPFLLVMTSLQTLLKGAYLEPKRSPGPT
jgi:hypothetical protein